MSHDSVVTWLTQESVLYIKPVKIEYILHLLKWGGCSTFCDVKWMMQYLTINSETGLDIWLL